MPARTFCTSRWSTGFGAPASLCACAIATMRRRIVATDLVSEIVAR
jgi:hypothetical protein